MDRRAGGHRGRLCRSRRQNSPPCSLGGRNDPLANTVVATGPVGLPLDAAFRKHRGPPEAARVGRHRLSATPQPPLTRVARPGRTLRAMTERAPHQSRPNRRYRRLVPTAVAVAALAAAGTSLGASPARAATSTAPPPKRAPVHGSPPPPATAARRARPRRGAPAQGSRTPAATVPRRAGATGPSTPGIGGG